MTWLERKEGHQIFFNRDERRTRRPARPPEPREQRGVRYLAPEDGDFGGSWIAVNEAGLTLALLNGDSSRDEEAKDPEGGYLSRGLLLVSLIDCATVATVLERLHGSALDRCRSFLLFTFEPFHPPQLTRWTGSELLPATAVDGGVPLVSSSFDTEEVRARRTELFRRMKQEWKGDPAALHLAYHASHLPARGAYSPCMHRPDARTVSFSRVAVDSGRAVFDYRADSPCGGSFPGTNRNWTTSAELVIS